MLQRLLSPKDHANDLDVLPSPCERFAPCLAVPALTDLWPGGAQPEEHAAPGEDVERGGRRRGCSRRASRHLHDRAADVDVPGRRRDRRHGRHGVAAVRLGCPHGVIAEAVRLLRQGDAADRIVVPELQTKTHRAILLSMSGALFPPAFLRAADALQGIHGGARLSERAGARARRRRLVRADRGAAGAGPRRWSLGAAHACRGGRDRRGVSLLRVHERGDRPLALGPARVRLPGAGCRQRRAPAPVWHRRSKARFLEPLVAGQVRSFFSMTEPDVAGSDPTTLQTRAVQDGDDWVIDGHKWFSSGADGAGFGIVFAVSDPEAAGHARGTMIIVPADTPGVDIVRPLSVMGHTGRGWNTHWRGSLHRCPRPAREHARRTGTRVPPRSAAPRPWAHPPRDAVARPDAARVRAHVHVCPRA